MSSFSHLIEINDFLNPLADLLTREQLWSGLVRRAEEWYTRAGSRKQAE